MDIALAGVSKRWQDLMDLEALELILAAGDIVPPAPLVFEALRYGNPSDINTVIICQGAIPNPSESLFGSLAWGGEATAPSGDPRPWAVQGVLKFNDSLMVRREAGLHDVAEWRPFIVDLLRRFCIERAEAGARIHFLLWGPGARVYAPLARHHNHAAREWAHPLVENGACPHFEEVNAALAASGRPPIVWDSLAPVIAFSDGACSRNGKPGARAAFAALITGAQFGATVIRGEVRYARCKGPPSPAITVASFSASYTHSWLFCAAAPSALSRSSATAKSLSILLRFGSPPVLRIRHRKALKTTTLS